MKYISLWRVGEGEGRRRGVWRDGEGKERWGEGALESLEGRGKGKRIRRKEEGCLGILEGRGEGGGVEKGSGERRVSEGEEDSRGVEGVGTL